MLVLVAGVTGNLGQKLVHSLISRGHKVRGMGRNLSKMVPEAHSLLESFIECPLFYDVAALDRACTGVDAVICAYGMHPRLQLDGQLLLLHAAERSGVKIFVAASWNHDWRNLELGKHESYDAYVSFRHQVEMTSDIKPIYVFNGIFAETLFSFADHGHFGPDQPNLWDPKEKRMKIWGTGHAVWYWTTEQDAAEFTAEILQRDDAVDGGFWNVCSGANSLIEIAEIYEQSQGRKVTLDIMGSVEDLRAKALSAREQGDKSHFERYIGWFYQLHAIDGTWTFPKLDNDKLKAKTTSLEEFWANHPEI
ncbi:hypothetical protein PCG10_007564 [Penicillium crustosum]|uniref:NmrA-like domain-containing protein n=1 Tax=Penicillium crustosum TaxID=36656 RepID=A0A9P5GLS6_PENCR|nr:uncharacterized protein N7487_010346 [Penicillium crustosum]KAF7522263.1 hypothetical protein PCG10_007564 [Penicillium crustosum]KAJ5396043.1 hypothetical protein N7487_010346 [Penicillium crustosum]